MSEPQTMSATEYLKRPYARLLIPDDESGTFTAEVLEFPGCIAQGNTEAEALAYLEKAAEAWIEAALEMGQEIPTARASQKHSGKVLVRLSRGLHSQAARLAEFEGTSLNQFIVTAIAERVGAAIPHRQLVKSHKPMPVFANVQAKQK